MKKNYHLLTLATLAGLAFSLVSCSLSISSNAANVSETSDTTDYSSVDTSIDTSMFNSVSSNDGTFTITTDVTNGYTVSDNVYTITEGGDYTLEGSLNGRIEINAEEGEVNLLLNGVDITSSSNSPIYVSAASKVKIKALADTSNTITDSRSTKTIDDSTQGEGAIYSKSDLDIAGKGTLIVEGNYNNGIHSADDLSIKNTSVKVTAYNNAIKGNDSVSIESGTIVAIAKTGDGIKTESTDVSSKGNQRGTVDITGGNIALYTGDDGIDASYNVSISNSVDSDNETIIPVLNIYTGSYSSYTTTVGTSLKGIKANNEVLISGGKSYIKSYDDGVHANYGTALDNGSTGVGNVTISGGETTIYAATTASNSRTMGSSTTTGGKGLHADAVLTISGGTINVTNSTEGMEAQNIIIAGGSSTIYAIDDGINASDKSSSVALGIDVTGGFLDITVGSGDVDGIDSNGYYKQTGGIVITRGASGGNNSMASGLDVDSSVSITGGTLIGLGSLESTPSAGSSVHYVKFGTTSSSGMGGTGFGPGHTSSTSSSITINAGTWALSGGSLSQEFTLTGTFYACIVYSSLFTSGTSVTLSSGSTSYSGTAS
jgi:hypothetical protein